MAPKRRLNVAPKRPRSQTAAPKKSGREEVWYAYCTVCRSDFLPTSLHVAAFDRDVFGFSLRNESFALCLLYSLWICRFQLAIVVITNEEAVCKWPRHTRACQGKCTGRNTSALAIRSGRNKIIYEDILTALADATNDLSMPCHEQHRRRLWGQPRQRASPIIEKRPCTYHFLPPFPQDFGLLTQYF